MRNLVYLGLAMFLLACFSCEDSTDQSSITTGQNEELVVPQERWIDPDPNWKWREYIEDNGQGKAVCGYDEVDCFPFDITIFPEHIRTINSIFNIIVLGDQEDIQSAFLAAQGTLGLYVDPTLVQGVINGTVIVECNLNGASGQKYMIFKDLSGNIIAVYPLI